MARRGLAQSPSPGPAVPPDPVAELAATLDHDRDRLFAFVRNEVRYEPYAGLLRGARGTLSSRAGNSMDQALLLAELLRAGAAHVRYASGPLDPAATEALMVTTRLDEATARTDVAQAIVSDADVEAGFAWDLPGTDPSVIAALPTPADLRAALAADRDALGQVAAEGVTATLDLIVRALTDAGLSIPGVATGMPALEQASHTWVQVEDGSTWLDLDPTMPDAGPGDHWATSGATFDVFADDMRHVVVFSVTLESLLGGVLAQEPVLRVSEFADVLQDANILFLHLPTDQATGVNLFGGLGAGTDYNPTLVIGDYFYIAQRPVSIGGGGGDPFGGFGGGGGLVEGEAAAEWLEVTVTSPGTAPVVARRVLFDRVGEVARRSGAADPYSVPPAELATIDPDGAAHFLPCRGLVAFAVTTGPVNLRAAADHVGSGGPAPLSMAPKASAALRHLLSVEMMRATGSRRFDDAPCVMSWTDAPTPAGHVAGLDIWHRSFGALGTGDHTSGVTPAMAAGVAHHVAERISMGEAPGAGPYEPPAGLSVGAILEAAAAQGIPVRAFTGTLPTESVLGPEPRLMVQDALDRGLVVVAPDGPVVVGGLPRAGWWLVDPTTGAAVDQRDDGGGADSDYIVVSSGAGPTNAGMIDYGWHVLNQAIRSGSRDPQVIRLTTRLFDMLWRIGRGMPLPPP
jgi:transglutaminase-like putative cysteine protease